MLWWSVFLQEFLALMPMNKAPSAIGIVVIGRNEGERLRVCLRSVVGAGDTVVYVDSGSTDDSVALARNVGAVVVPLDMNVPFTAARARNAGFHALLSCEPAVQFVQFVDGDCEVLPDWPQAGQAFLEQHAACAVVSGRLRERHPERSVYNRLCDAEWNTPVGEAKACGGIALMRAAAFSAVDGFREDLIAGEEPELCLRLRAAGWKIWRLDHDMALHDAAMTHWRQWWRRSVRGGFGFAQGAWLHGRGKEQHWVAETRRAVLWGIALPLLIVAGMFWWGAPALLLWLVYPLQVLRLYVRQKDAARAFFLVLGKFAEGWGVLKFVFKHLMRQRQTLIEYK